MSGKKLPAIIRLNDWRKIFMAKLDGVNIEIGEKVRQCNCGHYYSNHLSKCPNCGGQSYMVKELTREVEREIERQ